MRSIISVNVESDRDWPTGKEIENRNAVIQELADRNVGKFMWAGKGAKSMDFAFEVHDERIAKAMVTRAMSNHLPGWKYSVDVTPTKLANTFRLNSRHGIHAGAQVRQQKPGMGMGM